MAKGEAEITVRVKNEYIQIVDGMPNCLFVMKLDKPMPTDYIKSMRHDLEMKLDYHYPGSQLIILPYCVASIRHLNEEDLNEAGYFKREGPAKGINYCDKHGGYGFVSDCVECNKVEEERCEFCHATVAEGGCKGMQTHRKVCLLRKKDLTDVP